MKERKAEKLKPEKMKEKGGNGGECWWTVRRKYGGRENGGKRNREEGNERE